MGVGSDNKKFKMVGGGQIEKNKMVGGGSAMKFKMVGGPPRRQSLPIPPHSNCWNSPYKLLPIYASNELTMLLLDYKLALYSFFSAVGSQLNNIDS